MFETQIDRRHAACRRFPLADVVQQNLKLVVKTAVAEMHEHRVSGPLQTRQRRLQIIGIGKINFAHEFFRASAHFPDTGNKIHHHLHALRALAREAWPQKFR